MGAINNVTNKKHSKRSGLWRNIRKTYRYVRPWRKDLIMFAVISVVEAIIGVAVPMLSAQVILNITNNQIEQLILITLALLGVSIVMSVCGYFEDLFYRRVSRGMLVGMQVDVARETMKIETSELNQKSSGVFIDRLNNDTRDVAHTIVEYAYAISRLLANVGVLFAIFVLNKFMFLYFIGASVVFYVVQSKRIQRQAIIRREVKKLGEQRTGVVGEMVRGMVDIRALDATEPVLNRISNQVRSVYERQNELQAVGSRYRLLSQAIQDCSDFFMVVLGAILMGVNLLNIPSFITIISYKDRVKGLLSSLISVKENGKQFEIATDRIYEVIDDNVFDKEKFGSTHLDKFNGNIEFNNVSFSYDGKRKILDNISFAVKPNERVAFVGKSGAGKTTIFNLITRMYHADSGEVRLDGHNIEELDKASIRDNMSIITQSPYIFNFSIRENLKIAKHNASLKEMREACRLACIDDYIMSLPDKYDTMVGEGGVILSGGQKQRLAIARALLKRTEIILFDEATSALDNETQSQIQEAINNLQGEYTILIVAHRLSTIVDSDRIFVVDGGKIIADGTHKQLLKTCDFYHELYSKDLQK